MRGHISLFFLISLFCLCGCSGEDAPDNIILPVQEISVGAVKGSTVVTVRAMGTWTSSSSAGWCRALPGGGVCKYMTDNVVNIETDENTTLDARECEIRFECGGKTEILKVSQAAHSGFVIEDSDCILPPSACRSRAPFTANADYTYELTGEGLDWISVRKEADGLYLAVSDNTGFSRSCTLRIASGAQQGEIHICQRAMWIEMSRDLYEYLNRQGYDKDHDGHIDLDEVKGLSELSLSGDFESIQALSLFPDLKSLETIGGRISAALDISRFRSLTRLYVKYTDCTEINLSGNRALKYCEILSLDTLAGFSADDVVLDYLGIVSGALDRLSFSNSEIHKLYVNCSGISSLDVSRIGGLVSLEIEHFAADGLVISSPTLEDCSFVSCKDMDGITVCGCPGLSRLSSMFCQVGNLTVSECHSLNYVNFYDSRFSIDISGCESIEEIQLGTGGHCIYPSVNISGCRSLSNAKFAFCWIDELNLKDCRIGNLDCIHNFLKELDLSANEVEVLDCRDCSLLKTIYLRAGAPDPVIYSDEGVTIVYR